jgi:hypothetical protein
MLFDLASITDAHKMIMFAMSGLIGMLFSYYRRWSWLSEKVSLFSYLFGDWHAVGRALTTLILLCAGAGGLAYLQTLSIEQIIIAGFGLGLVVPDKVENAGVNERAK